MRIGVDLGGTKIEGILLDDNGQELARPRIPTPRDDYNATVRAIAGLVHNLESPSGRQFSVGIGMPGAVSPITGLVKNANSLWLNGRRLQQDLETALDRPLRLANDANCLAVSEAVDGAGSDARIVFGVILGTGVGGGLVIDRKPWTGRNAIGGEWGHTPLPWPNSAETDGAPCYCGHSGCIETWLSGPGMAAAFEREHCRQLTAPEIVRLAGEGDSEARAALDLYADRLGRALAMIADIIDPDVIVLGGGLSNLDFLYRDVPAIMERHAFSDGISTPIRRAAHGDSSGVRGAAWLWD